MAINKVVYGNQTLIDLTDSTLTSSDELVEGVTAYDRSGNRITGTADYMDKISNPSANKVLIDDGNGQAIDSSLSISDVATQDDLKYSAGDTFTVPGNYQIYPCYIATQSGSNYVRFFIPTDKKIDASTITCSRLTFSLQTSKNAGNAFLINGVNVVGESGYTVSCTPRNNGIYVNLLCPSSISLTNRDIGTVMLGYSIFTFS